MTHPEPFDGDLHDFILSPDGGDLDVDVIFAKRFDELIAEYRRDAPEDVLPDNRDQGVPSLFAPEMTYHEVPIGILLFHEGVAVGGYIGCDLVLAEEYRGRGLGTELVIERCLRDGSSPVWPLDRAAYSPAGLATHQAAWRHVQSHPDETAMRVARIMEEQS